MGKGSVWLAVLLLAVGPVASAAQWAETVSPHCRCRFSMPGAPTYSSRPADRGTQPFTVNQWDLETENAAYFVAATTFQRTEQDALENGVRGAWKGRKLISEKRSRSRATPAGEIVVADQSDRHITLRLLLVDTVLYQYGVRTVKGASNAPDTKKFFDSFTLDP